MSSTVATTSLTASATSSVSAATATATAPTETETTKRDVDDVQLHSEGAEEEQKMEETKSNEPEKEIEASESKSNLLQSNTGSRKDVLDDDEDTDDALHHYESKRTISPIGGSLRASSSKEFSNAKGHRRKTSKSAKQLRRHEDGSQSNPYLDSLEIEQDDHEQKKKPVKTVNRRGRLGIIQRLRQSPLRSSVQETLKKRDHNEHHQDGKHRHRRGTVDITKELNELHAENNMKSQKIEELEQYIFELEYRLQYYESDQQPHEQDSYAINFEELYFSNSKRRTGSPENTRLTSSQASLPQTQGGYIEAPEKDMYRSLSNDTYPVYLGAATNLREEELKAEVVSLRKQINRRVREVAQAKDREAAKDRTLQRAQSDLKSMTEWCNKLARENEQLHEMASMAASHANKLNKAYSRLTKAFGVLSNDQTTLGATASTAKLGQDIAYNLRDDSATVEMNYRQFQSKQDSTACTKRSSRFSKELLDISNPDHDMSQEVIETDTGDVYGGKADAAVDSIVRDARKRSKERAEGESVEQDDYPEADWLGTSDTAKHLPRLKRQPEQGTEVHQTPGTQSTSSAAMRDAIIILASENALWQVSSFYSLTYTALHFIRYWYLQDRVQHVDQYANSLREKLKTAKRHLAHLMGVINRKDISLRRHEVVYDILLEQRKILLQSLAKSGEFSIDPVLEAADQFSERMELDTKKMDQGMPKSEGGNSSQQEYPISDLVKSVDSLIFSLESEGMDCDIKRRYTLLHRIADVAVLHESRRIPWYAQNTSYFENGETAPPYLLGQELTTAFNQLSEEVDDLCAKYNMHTDTDTGFPPTSQTKTREIEEALRSVFRLHTVESKKQRDQLDVQYAGGNRSQQRKRRKQQQSNSQKEVEDETEISETSRSFVAEANSALDMSLIGQMRRFHNLIANALSPEANDLIPALFDLLIRIRQVAAVPALVAQVLGNSSEERDLDSALEEIITQACSIGEADQGFFVMVDWSNAECWVRNASLDGGLTVNRHMRLARATATRDEEEQEDFGGEDAGESGQELVGLRFPASEGIFGTVTGNGVPLVIQDAYGDPRFDPSWDEKTGLKTSNIVTIPVIVPQRGTENSGALGTRIPSHKIDEDGKPSYQNWGGRVIAMIQLANKKRANDFTPQDIHLLELLAAQASLVLANADSSKRRANNEYDSPVECFEATQEEEDGEKSDRRLHRAETFADTTPMFKPTTVPKTRRSSKGTAPQIIHSTSYHILLNFFRASRVLDAPFIMYDIRHSLRLQRPHSKESGTGNVRPTNQVPECPAVDDDRILAWMEWCEDIIASILPGSVGCRLFVVDHSSGSHLGGWGLSVHDSTSEDDQASDQGYMFYSSRNNFEEHLGSLQSAAKGRPRTHEGSQRSLQLENRRAQRQSAGENSSFSASPFASPREDSSSVHIKSILQDNGITFASNLPEPGKAGEEPTSDYSKPSLLPLKFWRSTSPSDPKLAGQTFVKNELLRFSVLRHVLGERKYTKNHGGVSIAGRIAGRGRSGYQVVQDVGSCVWFNTDVDFDLSSHPSISLICVPCCGSDGTTNGVLEIPLRFYDGELLQCISLIADQIGSWLACVSALDYLGGSTIQPTIPASLSKHLPPYFSNQHSEVLTSLMKALGQSGSVGESQAIEQLAKDIRSMSGNQSVRRDDVEHLLPALRTRMAMLYERHVYDKDSTE